MPSVSDEELQRKRQHVAELRQELSNAQRERAAEVRDAENDVQATQLDNETKRLQAQIDALKNAPVKQEEQNTNDNSGSVQAAPQRQAVESRSSQQAVSQQGAAENRDGE